MSNFAINGVELNGVSLPKIAFGGASCTVSDVDSAQSGRNQKGDMLRDRVAVKIKWQLSFPPLSLYMMKRLLDAISAPSFSFTYPDPRSGVKTTGTFYVGDRTTPVYSEVGGLPFWENISFSVIEM